MNHVKIQNLVDIFKDRGLGRWPALNPYFPDSVDVEGDGSMSICLRNRCPSLVESSFGLEAIVKTFYLIGLDVP